LPRQLIGADAAARGCRRLLSSGLLAERRRNRVSKLLVGLIGAGLQRSLSPALQEEEARQHGLRLHYQLIDIAGTGVEVLPVLIRAIRLMNFAGMNITFPCKQSVIPLLDELSDEARSIVAVSTVGRE